MIIMMTRTVFLLILCSLKSWVRFSFEDADETHFAEDGFMDRLPSSGKMARELSCSSADLS